MKTKQIPEIQDLAEKHARRRQEKLDADAPAQAQPRVTQSDIDKSLAEKQAQHSPLPWHISHYIGERDQPTIVDQRGDLIARTSCCHQEKANAAFIVRACNNAQRLADACRAAREANNCTPDVDKILNEALAQWEKEAK